MRTWVVQSNLGNEKELAAIAKACSAVGVPCVPIKAIPFDEGPVDGLDLLEDPIAYGSVGFVQRVHKQLGEAASLYDPDAFNTNSYRRHWGRNVLNDRPLFVGPLLWVAQGKSHFASTLCEADEDVFVRPVHDTKSFAGAIMKRDAVRSWAWSLEGTTVSMLDDIEICRAVRLEEEIRCWIVDGELVAWVVYRGVDRAADRGMPSEADLREVASFVETCAKCWSPSRAFVLDVTFVSGDFRPRIVEAGCITSAGFYNSNVVEDVVRAVSNMPITPPCSSTSSRSAPTLAARQRQ